MWEDFKVDPKEIDLRGLLVSMELFRKNLSIFGGCCSSNFFSRAWELADIIYFLFSKALDKMPRDILVSKVIKYGLDCMHFK